MSVATPASYRNVVGGERVDGLGDALDPVCNPATEEVIAQVPRGTRADVDRAVAAAATAAPAWGATTPAYRASALLALADRVDLHAEELTGLEVANAGKPRGAAADELPLCADHLRFFAGAARVLEGRAAGEYLDGYTSAIRREPVGVVGQITPWN
ncbi:MAG: aldehyde dehydrogenase family protein, partial [Solirubrobacteraceae bacterium]